MKHMPLFFVFALMLIAVGCQETTKTKTVTQDPQCAWYGTCGGTTGSAQYCTGTYYWTQPNCAGYQYCQSYPSYPACVTSGTTSGTTSGSTTGSTTSGTTGSTTGGTTTYPNPYRFYYSGYVDKNWMVNYPYVPSISCTAASAPSGISYTPYDTRKGSITLRGQVNYDPASGQEFFDTTSELLRTKEGSKNFFWGDSILKVRFIANVQPESRNTTTVCPGRVSGKSTMKGYGRIKFDLTLVGTTINGTTQTVSLGTKIIDVNKCTPALDLSSYAAQYPGGIYFKISNVWGNQEWAPGTYNEAAIYDTYGFIYPQNPNVSGTWKQVRTSDCWSLDIEVASNGTKTFN
ncbi:hypothetical protein [Peredibacter starrii]|uniref:CBM1 domain-containing protein n=1 Tax=Peredibacter starrii TaxID=28202 RepID=A0AAX4HMC1_9BACT|nr:hypothetical protein [Peredibacter starrii]WPU64409.1 hypothetical protein SOO65_17080 [Peredibacter starrii]